MFNSSDSKGNVSAYPLTWPTGWERTPDRERAWSNFAPRNLAECAKKIINEVRLMPGSNCVISSNVELSVSGLPNSNKKQVGDVGVAVYFTYRDKPIVFACDKWRRVEENLWAIAKHLEALRGQERWGVGNLEQAFQGYLALPAPEGWWEVLGTQPTASEDDIRAAYRDLARRTHPDAGGDQDKFVRVKAAYDRALKAKGK